MPRPRRFATNADRQRAYPNRKRNELAGLGPNDERSYKPCTDSGTSPPEPFLGFSKFEPGIGVIHEL